MSKNVQKVSGRPFFRIPVEGAPRLRGWVVEYVSGMDDPTIKPGYFMSHWNVGGDRQTATFGFEAELLMVFGDESQASAVSNALRDNADIETKVSQIG